MKKIYILFAVCAGILLTACARENQPETSAQGEISIRLTVPSMSTKTTNATDDENTVTSLDILVYDNVAAAPVWTSHVDISSANQLDGTYTQDGITPDDLGLSTDKSALLTMTVFAVANYPSSLGGTTLTLSQVKDLAVNADAFVTGATGHGVVAANPRFIMVAEGGFAMNTLTSVLADLTLSRLAAKVSLTLTYPTGSITTPGDNYGSHSTTVSWVPLSGENVRAYLDNAAMSATLGGPASPVPDGFTYADTHPSPSSTVDFYTYPFSWAEGGDRAPFIKIIQPWRYVRYYNDGSKDIILDENVVEFYYKVMFPGLTSLVSNAWYNTTVTVNVLGGEVESPVILNAEGLDVLGWGTATGVDHIALQPVKYLEPDENDVEVYNGSTVSIRYQASSTPTLTVNSIHKDVYINYDTDTKYIYRSSGSWPSSGVIDNYDASWITNDYNSSTHIGYINLNHTLSGDFFESDGITKKSNFAARPYIYNLSLDADGFHEDITITQYPPLYVQGQMSTGWVSIRGITTNFTPTYRAREKGETAITTLMVSPAYRLYTRWHNTVYNNPSFSGALGSVATYAYLDTDEPYKKNHCRWRIIIRPTAAENLYLVDPRIDISTDRDPNNTSNGDFGLFEVLNEHASNDTDGPIDGSPLSSNTDEQTSLKSYKPTKRKMWLATNDPVDHFPGIAPEYMVASSYGKTVSINFMAALVRCAGYQEDGFPAGRWRIPTEEEIEMAIKLADRNAIPKLFDGKYWASSGRYISSDTGKWTQGTNEQLTNIINEGTHLIGVRCVYDTWYWGREEESSTKDGTYTEGGKKYQKYKWSGYMTAKTH